VIRYVRSLPRSQVVLMALSAALFFAAMASGNIIVYYVAIAVPLVGLADCLRIIHQAIKKARKNGK
jgi:uncharacterized membrane protein YjjP (DUF1212 family)